jgi:predicted nucleic acid-binding protein
MALEIPPIVAVDSMTLVWGLREQGDENQCVRAKWLLDQFTSRVTQVILSAPALAEYLTAVDPQHHEAVQEALEKRFLLRPLSPECAPVAAALFQIGTRMRVKGEPGGRAILRADTFILAAAKTHGAARLYSNDGDCRNLANAMWPDFAHDLPDPPIDLFGQVLRNGR